jgi:hypothetical protein
MPKTGFNVDELWGSVSLRNWIDMALNVRVGK